MTREQFVKLSFKAYMLVHYVHPRVNKKIECMITEIDFDNELFCLSVMDSEYGIPTSHYGTFYTSIRHVQLIPKQILKVKK